MLYRTAAYDRFNNVTRFYYQTSGPLLKYVVDPDGRTNTLSYTGSLVTEVQDPFGRTTTLQYDSGVLASITDVAGISSSFKYNLSGWITNLTTPYGSTSFELTDSGFAVGSGIIRAARVIDAASGTNVYMLTQCTGPTGVITPDVTENGTYEIPQNFDGQNAFYIACRNSYHWGPRQASGLPSDLNEITSQSSLVYLARSRMRHWLHSTNFYNDGQGISQIMSIEVQPLAEDAFDLDGPSPFGQATFFDQANKADLNEDTVPDFYNEGDSLPSLIARRLPDNTTWFTWYRRDNLGRPTNVVDTYSTGYGVTPLLRTNCYIYSGPDLVTHIGPNGNVEDGYTYNAHHQLTFYTNAVGEVTSYIYDAFGRLTSTHTPAGLTTTNIYFPSGGDTNFVQTVIDLEINRTNSYTWTNDLVYTHKDERGIITTNIYDNLQRMTNVLDSLGIIIYRYDKLDLVQVVDRMNFTNSFVYDNVRRKIFQTNALGFYTHYIYCSCGALDAIQDMAGNSTLFYYDNAGQMTNVIYPDLYSVTNAYDRLGELITATDSAGSTVTHWYNNQGLRYNTFNDAGQISALAFDVKDRPIYVVDANGVTTTNAYDAASRLLTRGYPDGGVEKFGYSPSGLIAYTNQLTNVTFYAYDPARRKTFETNANSEIIRYTNSPAGDLLSLTDGKGQTTRWNYDSYGRVTNKVDQAGSEILRYKYDADNRLTNRWSTAKGNTAYSYDAAGNLTFINYPASPDVTLKYDKMNLLTNLVDAVGTTIYKYTEAGQLLSEDGPFASDTVTNIYSSRLRIGLGLQQPTGVWTNAFGYDLAKRLTNVTSSAGGFGYDYPEDFDTRLVRKLWLPNTSYITNVYDGNARLIGTLLKNSGDAAVDSEWYGYNVANQRYAVQLQITNFVSYTYDKIGQLTVANSTINAEDRGYAYDSAWNVSYVTNNGVASPFTVDGKNQLVTDWDGYNYDYEYYDGNGNLEWQVWGSDPWWWSSSDLIYQFVYDDENRLVSLLNYDYDQTAQFQTDFAYDGLGRLRKRTEWAYSSYYENMEVQSVTEYVYDGMRVIQERDGSNVPVVSYTRGSDLSGTMEGAGGIGGLLARSHGYSSGNFSTHNYYHADGNGNITYLVNSSQTLAASYKYDPFGNILASSGSLATANTYRFSSKEYIASAALYYYGYRFYSPNLQRWLNRDPIEERGGRNLYRFVRNDPNDFVDGKGRSVVSTAATLRDMIGCVAKMKAASDLAVDWVNKNNDHYDCGKKPNGKSNKIEDFPGAADGTSHTWGTPHCLTGYFANALGAGTGCLSAANVGWELIEVFTIGEWSPSKNGPGGWLYDTFEDMTDLFTGAKLGSPEDCLPCQCKKK